MISGIAVC